MGARDGGWFRRTYNNISGKLTVLAATDDTTLVSVRGAAYTIYIQKIIFEVTTDAAQSMSFEDSASTPLILGEIPASPGDSTTHIFDYGEEGFACTEGKDFKMMVSAAGLAGTLKWYGYQRQTGLTNLTTANTAN